MFSGLGLNGREAKITRKEMGVINCGLGRPEPLSQDREVVK